MTRGRSRRDVRHILLVVVLLHAVLTPSMSRPAPSHASRTKSAAQLRQDLSRVRSRIAKKRAEIRKVKRTERRICEEIDAVESQIQRAERRIEYVRSRLATLRQEHTVISRRITETERRLAGRRRVLAFRMRQTYQQGRDGFLHVLLASRSMHEYMARSYYIEKIVDADTRLIRAIRSDELDLRADRQRLERQLAEQRSLETELIARRAEYRASVDRKRDLLADVRTTRRGLEEALDILEQASQDIAARIRAMQMTPRGRARMLKAWTGRFIRPVDGPVTSNYGMRFHPILHRSRMHTGVDFGAGYGTPIRAAAGGEVVMASYMRGYGNTVVIDHGGGVTTLYAHCSALLVGEGQSVRQGQVIARVGSTGLSTGPHLHFEVRHNGTPVNPR